MGTRRSEGAMRTPRRCFGLDVEAWLRSWQRWEQGVPDRTASDRGEEGGGRVCGRNLGTTAGGPV